MKGHSHVVSSDDVESQHHLLHPLTGAEHPLVTLIQDQVYGLIEALQSALNAQTHTVVFSWLLRTFHWLPLILCRLTKPERTLTSKQVSTLKCCDLSYGDLNFVVGIDSPTYQDRNVWSQDKGDHSDQLCIDQQWLFPLRGQVDPFSDLRSP